MNFLIFSLSDTPHRNHARGDGRGKMQRRKPIAAPKVQKELYETTSGMGGLFDVVITKEEGDIAWVSVHMPSNPDWHGFKFSVNKASLKSMSKKVQVAA